MKQSFITLIIVLLSATILLSISSESAAVIEAVEFDDPSHEKRYKNLIEELRCLVCQNQNLAGSDAPLAKDLREITASMLKSGASDKEIKQFMRERYGDFVLYDPPFSASTAFLWLGPIVLLIGVIVAVILTVRRRQQDEIFKPAQSGNEAERVKVRNLLRDAPSLNSRQESNTTRDDQPD